VDRHANRTTLVRNRSGNRLANPPRRIGREFIATFVLKFINGTHQPRIALLNKIQETQPAVAVLFGNRNDQA